MTTRTRYAELGYRKQFGHWRIIDLSGDAEVGAIFATRAELLEALPVFASMFGCPEADPYVPPCTCNASLARAEG